MVDLRAPNELTETFIQNDYGMTLIVVLARFSF